MTAELIENIEGIRPGNSLDAIVARVVFGFKLNRMPYWGWLYRVAEKGMWTKVKPYSSDMEAAWEAVERVRLIEPDFSLYKSGDTWCASWGRNAQGWNRTITADTAPVAAVKGAILVSLYGRKNRPKKGDSS